MPTLHIALQEGFEDDAVTVTVNESSVYDREGVSTRLQIGLADSVDVEVQEDSASVTVTVDSRNVADSVQVQMSRPKYLAVNLAPNGALELKESDEPFGYL